MRDRASGIGNRESAAHSAPPAAVRLRGRARFARLGSRSSIRAFTLIEVLVATVILAIGLLAGLAAFSMATHATAASSNDTELPLLAQSKFAEVQATPRDDLQAGTTSGDFGEAHAGYTWEMTISPPDDLHVVRVDLTIHARQSGRDREAKFSTAIF